MEKNYAIVENGVVTNVIVLDSTDEESISYFDAIEIGDQFIDIGFTYENGIFINPNPIKQPVEPVEPDLTFDEIEAILLELTNANQVPT